MAKSFQVDTNGTLTTSLVAYYKLNDATDFWGTNDLTNVASVTFVDGKVGNCAQFNGTTQKLTTTTQWADGIGAMTMAGWVFLTSTNQRGLFFGNGEDLVGWQAGVGSTADADSTGNNFDGVAATVAWLPFGTFGSANWHFVVMTYDGAGNWNGYVDNGAAVSRVATPHPNPTGGSSLGWAKQNTADYFFNGNVDEFGFWSKVLSAQERTDLYHGGNGQTMYNNPNFRVNKLRPRIFAPGLAR